MHNDTPDLPLWFYEENGERHGTLDETQMIELIHAGRFDQHTPVWRIGDTDWRLLGETELGAHLRALSPAAPPARPHDNRLAWLLAFAPLLGYLLEWLMAFAFSGSALEVRQAMETSRYWPATLALHILLGVLDVQQLQQVGHDTRHLRSWVWLAPAYLYQRARQQRHSRGPLAVWLAACSLLLLA